MSENLDSVLPEIRALQGLSAEPTVDRAEAEADLQVLRDAVWAELSKRYGGQYISKAMVPEVASTLTKAVRRRFRGAIVKVSPGKSGEIYVEAELEETK